MKLKNLYTVLFLAVIAILSGCEKSTIYSFAQDLENETWSSTDTLRAKFELQDTTHYFDVFVENRFNSLYPYSNIYYKVELDGPGGQQIIDVKSFEITDKSGKWLGGGFGDLHSYSFPVIKDLAIKQTGTYKLKIIPYMRTDQLKGVHDYGVKVSKGKEIF